MPEPASHSVSASDLESRIADLKRSAPSSSASLLAPNSINWKVNRQSALFLAATRAALLQLAHPWVATAIAQHSTTFQNPISRFHQTFRVMFTMSFGSVEQAIAVARQLHRRHQGIRGTLTDSTGRFASGTPYQANQLDALLWVYATLIDSSVLAYELVLPPLTDAEREQYYRESKQMASLFGIPPECWPQDWNGFCLYLKSALQSDMLGASPATRAMAHRLQDGAGLKLRPPFWYRALTVQLLPPRFRQEFQFAYGKREQRSADRAVQWFRWAYPWLPPALRFVGPYNEAQSRLKGSLHPGFTTRLSNRLWIGQPSLFGSRHST